VPLEPRNKSGHVLFLGLWSDWSGFCHVITLCCLVRALKWNCAPNFQQKISNKHFLTCDWVVYLYKYLQHIIRLDRVAKKNEQTWSVGFFCSGWTYDPPVNLPDLHVVVLISLFQSFRTDRYKFTAASSNVLQQVVLYNTIIGLLGYNHTYIIMLCLRDAISSRRSVARPIAATIASCKHRVTQ